MRKLEGLFFEALSGFGFRVYRNVKFPWLQNKVDLDCPRHQYLNVVFRKLKGDTIGLAEKRRTAITSDFFVSDFNCILEFDELQHFTRFRADSLSCYPSEAQLGFDIRKYQKYCATFAEQAEAKGPAGYRRPTRDFPFICGRHAQRAFLDVCRDLLPTMNGLEPTIRISEIDVPALGRGEILVAREQIADLLGFS